MAIRFQCGACSQPIEVDDQWALRAVACPYCRKTITAPSESTLGDLSRIPMATPLFAGGAAAALPSPSAVAFAPAVPNRNPLAVAAFILSCAMMLCLLLGVMIGASHSLELEQIQREIRAKGSDSASQVQAMMDYLRESGGGFPWWLVAMSLFEISSMALCAAAILCGVLGLRRAGRRPLAVIALVSSACLGLFFCLSFLSVLGGIGLRQ